MIFSVFEAREVAKFNPRAFEQGPLVGIIEASREASSETPTSNWNLAPYAGQTLSTQRGTLKILDSSICLFKRRVQVGPIIFQHPLTIKGRVQIEQNHWIVTGRMPLGPAVLIGVLISWVELALSLHLLSLDLSVLYIVSLLIAALALILGMVLLTLRVERYFFEALFEEIRTSVLEKLKSMP